MTRTLGRLALGAFLLTAGIGHLTSQRQAFRAQVPEWVPLPKDTVVLASGGVEIALGSGLLVLGTHKRLVGRLTALFFVAIFPGNISQYVTKTSAFGLDTDRKRAIRLLFQPWLVAWALWSTRKQRSPRRSTATRLLTWHSDIRTSLVLPAAEQRDAAAQAIRAWLVS